MIKIKRGLDLPISGQPQQSIIDGPKARTVAVLGGDFVGMRPTMHVQVGDQVQKGQLLFVDKKTEGVRYTAPAAGKVCAIHRGHKRALLSVVIEAEGDAEINFTAYSANQLASLDRQLVVNQLVESGLWTSLRTRPFSKVPAPASSCQALFITATDSNPLALDPQIVIAERGAEFQAGLTVLKALTKGNTYLCTADGANIPSVEGVKQEAFGGPHPSGLVGTHIHFLDPASETKTVWHIGYQDVIAVGALFTSGKLDTRRVVALAGPQVDSPQVLRTQLGICLSELTAGKQLAGDNRVISGSVLSGTHAHGPIDYLGRYHTQVSVLLEGREREFMRYVDYVGKQRHSITRTYLSKLFSTKPLAMNTTTNGSERAMVPIGLYERVMPLDILPTYLLRAIIVRDTVGATELGCLELDEEDLALCTYVCAGKYEYGSILRENLTIIEKEG